MQSALSSVFIVQFPLFLAGISFQSRPLPSKCDFIGLAPFLPLTHPMNEAIACKTCGLVQHLEPVPAGCQAVCERCDEVLVRAVVSSRARTAAFALAALFLYVPANIYPLMIMEYMGRHSENTVWGGVQALYQDHMWYIAAIVFVASILFPLLKLLGLFYLVSYRGPRWQKSRTWIYRVVCQIGPWAMLDVFLLSILVALIRFGRFADVIPGPGIYAFVSVVALTLLASSSFDPQLLWKSESNGSKSAL